MRLTGKGLGVAAIVCLSAYVSTGCQVQTTAQAYPDQYRKDWASWPAVDCIEHVQPEIVAHVAAAMAQLDRADPNYKAAVCDYVPAVRLTSSQWKKGHHLRKGMVVIDAYWMSNPVRLAGVLYHEGMHGYAWWTGLSKTMSLPEEERWIMGSEAVLVESLGDPEQAAWLRSQDGHHNEK